jgi:hypothetical protein
MNEIDLTQFEPSWRNYPAVPSRISDGSLVFQPSRLAEVSDIETSPPLTMETAPEIIPSGTTAVSVVTSGAFCGTYTTESGDIYLQGGTISDGGGGGAPESLDDFKVADAGGVGAFAGDILYLKAGITAKSADGLMIPGVKLNSVVFTRTTPTAHEFKSGALTGDVFIEVGRWSNEAFLPSGTCGLSRVGGCPGSYGIY